MQLYWKKEVNKKGFIESAYLFQQEDKYLKVDWSVLKMYLAIHSMSEIHCNKIDRTHLQNHLKKALPENTIL